MLRSLTIRDFSLIDRLELEFENGLSVLTGETGAGKSLLFDALSLVLGGRASADFVRPGADRADVTARFDLQRHSEARDWLDDHDLDEGDELLLRRAVNADGRSRGYINGAPAPIGQLRELGDLLIEIHGQHEFQTLNKAAEQLRLLDLYAAHDDALAKLAQDFAGWRDAASELESLRTQSARSPAELELMRHQVSELERHAVDADALEALHADHRRLSHAEALIEATSSAMDRLAGNPANVIDELAAAVGSLESQLRADPALAEPLDLLNSALLQAQEAESVLRRQLRELETDPEALAGLDRQLGEIHDLARKHRVEAGDLMQHLEALRTALHDAEHAGERETELAERVAMLDDAYRKQAAKVSKARVKAGKKLASSVTATIARVGMENGEMQVAVEFEADAPPRRPGLDKVTFLVRTNPGSDHGPLSKVASGGELSRVALAIKVGLADSDRPRSMIFDEVDAGVGGAVAGKIGNQLRNLADSGQVLCVTHLPQVAACAHHHYQVDKQQSKRSTTTRVTRLDGNGRLLELARMLGGIDVTEQTLAHAREMLAMAEKS